MLTWESVFTPGSYLTCHIEVQVDLNSCTIWNPYDLLEVACHSDVLFIPVEVEEKFNSRVTKMWKVKNQQQQESKSREREGTWNLASYLLEGLALAPTVIEVQGQLPQRCSHVDARLRLAAVAHEGQNQSNSQDTARAWVPKRRGVKNHRNPLFTVPSLQDPTGWRERAGFEFCCLLCKCVPQNTTSTHLPTSKDNLYHKTGVRCPC